MQITKEYIDKINPKNSPRYSACFYRFLKKNYLYSAEDVQVVDIAGSYLIGRLDGRAVVGFRLSSAMTAGGTQGGCYFNNSGAKTKVIKDFFDKYAELGLCLIDKHRGWWAGSIGRWEIEKGSRGNIRICLWCRNHRQKKRVKRETVTHVTWEPQEGGK